jgi:hypothetical protein
MINVLRIYGRCKGNAVATVSAVHGLDGLAVGQAVFGAEGVPGPEGDSVSQHGPQPMPTPPIRIERLQQGVPKVSVPVGQDLPAPGRKRGLVAVDASQHGLTGPVEAHRSATLDHRSTR